MLCAVLHVGSFGAAQPGAKVGWTMRYDEPNSA